MALRSFIAVVLLVATNWAAAESLSINLSDDAARVNYTTPMLMRGMGDSYLEMGFAYNEDNQRAGEDLLLHLGIGVGGDAGGDQVGVDVGAGVRATIGEVADQDVLVMGLGGHIRFSPAQMARLGFALEAFYAPKIVSFLDVENYREYQARLEFRFANTATAYVGYRQVKFDLVDFGKDVDFDKGTFVGLKLGF